MWEDIYIDKWQFWLLVGGIGLVVVLAVASLYIRHASTSGKGGTAIVGGASQTSSFATRDIVFGGVALAVAFVLNLFPVFSMPFGGSITLGHALPLLLYSYFFGFRKGLVVCFGFMLLQLISGPYIITPFSAVLDYVVPSFAYVLAGIFVAKAKSQSAFGWFALGVCLYFVLRLASHALAGVIFWAEGIDFGIWQGDLVGWSAWGYSLVYNLLYLVPDTLIALVAGYFVLKNKSLINVFEQK